MTESPTTRERTTGAAPEETVTPGIAAVTEAVVDLSRRYAQVVVAGCFALTVLFGWYMATHLGIDAQTENLIDPTLPWRQSEAEIRRLFPQHEGALAIVIDGATPEIADDAAARLAARLAERPDRFTAVSRPDALEFFRRNGLLFLPADQVEHLTDSLAKAQPLLAALAADPSVNGLFGALNLALDGAAMGQMDAAELDRPFTAIADALSAAQAGHGPPLSWQGLLTDRSPDRRELQRIILARPVLDFSQLAPGAAATDLVRAMTAELGLNDANGVRVRLTGTVALNDEEYMTVTKGIGFCHHCLVPGGAVLAVPRPALVQADSRHRLLAAGGPRLDARLRRRGGRRPQPDLGGFRHHVHRHRRGFRHPGLRPLPRRALPP
jgi:hypothetical protein